MKKFVKKSVLCFSVCAIHFLAQAPLAMIFPTDESYEGAKKSYNSKKNNHISGRTNFTNDLLNHDDLKKSKNSDLPKLEEVSQVSYAPKNSFAITTRSGKTVADGEEDQATMLELQSKQPEPNAWQRFFQCIFCCGKKQPGSENRSSSIDSADSTEAQRQGENKANQHKKEQQQDQQLFAASESSINKDQSGFLSNKKDSLLK